MFCAKCRGLICDFPAEGGSFIVDALLKRITLHASRRRALFARDVAELFPFPMQRIGGEFFGGDVDQVAGRIFEYARSRMVYGDQCIVLSGLRKPKEWRGC